MKYLTIHRRGARKDKYPAFGALKKDGAIHVFRDDLRTQCGAIGVPLKLVYKVKTARVCEKCKP
jgi:hypothetical protein